MTNYEQKLRGRAEEFAKECEHMAGSFPASIIDLARLSLQREAEAYQAAFFFDTANVPIDEYWTTQLKQQLQSLGLVP